MTGWPWPLDGVQGFFEALWNHIVQLQQNAITGVVLHTTNTATDLWSRIVGWFTQLWDWIRNAINWVHDQLRGALDTVWTAISGAFSGLWTSIVNFFGNLWNWINSGLSSLWNSISGALGSLWNSITGALGSLWTGIVNTVGNLWDSITGALGSLWTGIVNTVGSLWDSITGAVGSLWTNIVNFVSNVGNDLWQGIQGVGNAVWGALNAIGSWISDLLKGMGAALGAALQDFLNWFWGGLAAAAGAIANALNEYVVKPIMSVFNWIRDAIFNVLQDLWKSITGFFGSHSPITPEEAAAFTVPLLLISSGAGFGISVMGAVGELHVLGSGLKATAITDFVKDAFAMGDISRSLIMPIFSAAYAQPVQYYYNAMFRPRIPDTRTADQMLFEQHISEAEWRQIYRYHGWKEQHIDAWYKTMWREPSQLILRNMVMDPDTDPAWLQRKYREIGFIGEDFEALLSYGTRQALRDERNALATQIQTDLADEAITTAEAEADLKALKFTPMEISYKIAKALMIRDRKYRQSLLKKPKGLTESDLGKEFELALITAQEYEADMVELGYSAYAASRKLRLLVTPRPITPEEIERRKRVITAQINRVKRRYELQIARLDKQAGLISGEIEAASAVQVETLDVIDTEIASIDAELKGITPVLVTEPILRRIAAVKRRYELALAGLDRRATLLSGDLEDTTTIMSETLDVIDVEIAAVESELAELGVAG